MTPEQAKLAGYCITSRRHLHATRIDREDWREHMAKKHCPWDPEGAGMTWALGSGAGDQYRRVYSRDTIVVPAAWLNLLPNSGSGPNRFMPTNQGESIMSVSLVKPTQETYLIARHRLETELIRLRDSGQVDAYELCGPLDLPGQKTLFYIEDQAVAAEVRRRLRILEGHRVTLQNDNETSMPGTLWFPAVADSGTGDRLARVVLDDETLALDAIGVEGRINAPPRQEIVGFGIAIRVTIEFPENPSRTPTR